MISVNNVTLQFGGRVLFENVNLKFTKGNCYGIIGANGAGKSTFLRILSGELEPNKGDVTIDKNERMSVLMQNQNAYDAYSVRETVMWGHKRLMEVAKEREALYSKPDFSDADGERAAELEGEFADMNGYEAESAAETLLSGLKIDSSLFDTPMSDMDAKLKVKVLLAQSLFGSPDILVLDEPTNNLDAKTVKWLEGYLMELTDTTVIIVSHNRHFLNRVCTHICDVDFKQINVFVGNYDFWYETSQLLARQAKEQNKKMEARAKELQEFIARFSANASKSKQATSRKRELEKIKLEDIKPSSRRYPFIDFKYEREIGNEILEVEGLTKKGFFENVSFKLKRDDKIGFLCSSSQSMSMLFDVLMGLEQPDSGYFKWGQTITTAYLPQNYDNFFDGVDLSLVEWLSQYSKDHYEEYLRGWLGRMLFSGQEALKKAKVLSGGEKVRCMLARMMLLGANFLIFDEPTNHLDLESITALNKGMTNFKGGMLFVTHDEEIISTVANRIIEIEGGKKIFDRDMTYDEYLELDA
ncbi:MAG: ATP-binding cassette domain-containing protein [Clostridia bacterium]|uniref:ABC-F family ATP-binding cassette domain-containing protein n=1 Tax=Pumilibacter muris TaxID=2941510 RepID=UPI002040786B|nr:ATP-binding cassette domain-containing protein [Pumilibacter muris]MCI8596092.1 ATP-binding cassette domain-containing protein [Clostridia bacterium]